MTQRAAPIAQFVVHVADPDLAATFYRSVFGWALTRGPSLGESAEPTAYVVENPVSPEGPFRGHIWIRQAAGPEVRGVECIVAVDSLDAVRTAIVAHGGRILEDGAFPGGQGGSLRFADPDGNVVTAFHFTD